jgi:hypothetical protein
MSANACFGLVGVFENKAGKSSLQKIFGKCFSLATVFLLMGMLLPQFARATQIVWTNKASGTWETAVNWSPNQVPGPNDTATITNATAITVSVLAGETVSGLTISTSSLVGSNQMQISGQLYMTNATVALPIELESQATGSWERGNFSGVLTVDNGATLFMTTPTGDQAGLGGPTNRAMILNNGTLVFTNFIVIGKNATIQNNGLVQDLGNSELNGEGVSNFFINTGDYEKTGTNNSFIGGTWQFSTTGIINTPAGVLGISSWIGTNILNGFLNISGGIIPANADLTVATNSTLFWSDGDISGTLTIASGALLKFGVFGGQLTFGVQSHGLGLTNAATLINDGLVIVTNGAFFTSSNPTLIKNTGEWQFISPLTLFSISGLQANLFINSGSIACGTNNVDFGDNWIMTNSGSIVAGELSLGFLEQTAGSTAVQNAPLLSTLYLFGGTFSGAGVVFTCVNDGGTLVPGSPLGNLEVNQYTQTARGTLDVFVGDPTNGLNNNSELEVAQSSSLAGQLNIFLTNNYLPDLGASYTIISGRIQPNAQTNFSSISFPSNVVNMSVMTDSSGTNLDLYIEPPVGPAFYKSNFVAQLLGIPGTNYTIEATASLSPPDWQKVTNEISQTSSNGIPGVIQIIDPAVATNRFYRAVTPAY